MILRVKLLGTGKQGDPYRVNLPEYELIHGNITQGYAIVRVSDGVLGVKNEDIVNDKTEQTTEGPLHVQIDAKKKKDIHANLDSRYAEHKGEFRLQDS